MLGYTAQDASSLVWGLRFPGHSGLGVWVGELRRQEFRGLGFDDEG